MAGTPGYSDHALRRLHERTLSPIEADYVAKHGTRLVEPDGSIRRVLKYSDLPRSDRKSHARLVGATAILSSDETEVITSYRCEGRCSDSSPCCFCWGSLRRQRRQLVQ